MTNGRNNQSNKVAEKKTPTVEENKDTSSSATATTEKPQVATAQPEPEKNISSTPVASTEAPQVVVSSSAESSEINPVDYLRKALREYAVRMRPRMPQTTATLVNNQKHLLSSLEAVLRYSDAVFGQAIEAVIEEFDAGGAVFTERYLMRGFDDLVRDGFLNAKRKYQYENMISVILAVVREGQVSKEDIDMDAIVASFVDSAQGNRFGTYFAKVRRNK